MDKGYIDFSRKSTPVAETVYLTTVEYGSLTFGIEHDGETVLRVPPVAKWAMGKKMSTVIDYYRRLGATFLGHMDDRWW